MKSIAILGAGELGATLARLLADREQVQHVVLVDRDDGRARGKALDIRQAGPVEGSDMAVDGAPDLAAAGPVDVVVVADTPDLADREGASNRVGDFMRALVPALGKSLLLIARADAAPLIEAAVRSGLPRARVFGSMPVAVAAALRRRLATELRAEPREIAALALGDLPDHIVMPRGSATLAGLSIERLSPGAARAALDATRGCWPGPVALAAAAARILRALASKRSTLLPVVAALDGEYGYRRIALAVPARLGPGGMEEVVEYALDPADRTAFDTGAQRRLEAR